MSRAPGGVGSPPKAVSTDLEGEEVYKFRRGAKRQVVHIDRDSLPDGARIFSALRNYLAPNRLDT